MTSSFNQIVIVEGLHDEIKLKDIFPNIKTISTNGSEISEHTLNLIKTASLSHEIILFFDPDAPGERIRNKVLSVVPDAKHAFIAKHKCISQNKKKVGVEHALKKDIIESLNNLLTPSTEIEGEITFNMLVNLKLIGHKDSARLRDELSTYFNIGKPNGKTLLKRLNMFGITKDKILKYFEKL